MCLAEESRQAPTDDDKIWRDKIGFNPQARGSVEGSSDADTFARVPYAYYPSTNELEVAFDLAAALRLLPTDELAPADDLSTLSVRVFSTVIAPERQKEMPFLFAPTLVPPLDPNTAVASGTIALDAKGRGYGVIRLPELPAGNYRVEYEFGGTKLVAGKVFRRTRFAWENCTFGTEHVVYPPFTPVVVKGARVSVVDRTYTVNALGLFDSVISKGRELLAAPMRLVAEDADGKQIEWQADNVNGSVLYPDLATFECSTHSSFARLRSTVSIEEDGCAKVTWTLQPGEKSITVRRMWLEIALNESEAPLCHFVGLNSMRNNYAGKVPRGGKIIWFNQNYRPARFEVEPFAGSVPASYQVWEARNQMHWGGEKWNFAPYVWLGAEERGLAWFGDHTQGYEADGTSSIQRLFIEPGRAVLRVDLFQQPVALKQSRQFEFGLQASPTKPMRVGWRGYQVPDGCSIPHPVWGGFDRSEKVPPNGDWTIVDKLTEGHRTGKADMAWFERYAKTHTIIINEGGGARPGVLRSVPLEQARAGGQMAHTNAGGQTWSKMIQRCARIQASRPVGVGTTVLFEAHLTRGDYPEVAEFTDEWGDDTFSRFRFFDHPRTWGPPIRSANPKSYRDFAVFYANEWMKRGIGIFFDHHVMPMVDLNRHHFAERGVKWSSIIWGHRDYYKRVWKRSRELMATGVWSEPLHIIGNVMNCQVLPYTTWWDATLTRETPGQLILDQMPSPKDTQEMLAECSFVKVAWTETAKPGHALPCPPDYLRVVECGRTAGLIPHTRLLLKGDIFCGLIGGDFGAADEEKNPGARAHLFLADAAMGIIHEIRGGGNDHPAAVSLRHILNDFGYGKPDVKVHNYWDEKPFAEVGNPDVKWIALERSSVAGGPPGLVLLQSYRAEATRTSVRFPGAIGFVDVMTRALCPVDRTERADITLDADCGTRLLYALRNMEELGP